MQSPDHSAHIQEAADSSDSQQQGRTLEGNSNAQYAQGSLRSSSGSQHHSLESRHANGIRPSGGTIRSSRSIPHQDLELKSQLSVHTDGSQKALANLDPIVEAELNFRQEVIEHLQAANEVSYFSHATLKRMLCHHLVSGSHLSDQADECWMHADLIEHFWVCFPISCIPSCFHTAA